MGLRADNGTIALINFGLSLLDEVALLDLVTNLVLGVKWVSVSLRLPVFSVDVLVSHNVIRHHS